MEYKTYRNMSLSRLGYGCMRFPLREGSETTIDEAKAEKLLEDALTSGVNYFDTAFPYHGRTSEEFVGRVLGKHPRDSFHIATKLPLFSIKTLSEAEEMFTHQLETLKTGYFDFYLLHAMNKERFELVKKLGIYDMLIEKKKAGLIRNLGFSFHDTPDVLEAIVEEWDFDFAQLQLNYVDWVLQNAEKQYDIITSRNIPVIVMEPVRGGALANLPPEAEKVLRAVHPDWSNAAWAFRYVANLPNVLVVLSGMGDAVQVEDNIKTFSTLKPLIEEELDAIAKVRNIFLEAKTVKCTACRYCLPCTKGIMIPDLFRIYNSYLFTRDGKALAEEYSKEAVRGIECIDCRKCMKVCPQQLEISKLVREVDRTAAAML